MVKKILFFKLPIVINIKKKKIINLQAYKYIFLFDNQNHILFYLFIYLFTYNKNES